MNSGGLEPVEHCLGVDEAGLLLDEAATGEDGEVGDAAHVVTGGELRAGFGVDLEDEAAAGDLAGGAFDVRRGHAAGTAPFRPEIDEYRDARVGDDVVEEGGVGGDGFSDGRERLPKLPQRPVSARCAAGMRFLVLQFAQERMRGMSFKMRAAHRTVPRKWPR